MSYLNISLILLTFLVVCVYDVNSAVVVSTPASNITNATTQVSIKAIEKSLEGLLNTVSKMLLPYFVRNSDLNMSPQCMSTLVKMFVDVRKLKVSAIKLLDAIAKPPFGMLQGSFAAMGDYDECLSVSANKKGDIAKSRAEEFYHGQYCTVEIRMPPSIAEGMRDYGLGKKNLSDFGKLGKFIDEFPATGFSGDYFNFHAGICMPSTCTPQDLEEVLKQVPVTFLPMKVKRCESKEDIKLPVDQIIILSVLGIVAVLVIIGTLYEGAIHLFYSSDISKNKSKCTEFLLSFSWYCNTKKLLKTEKNSTAEIRCINGMYVLGTFLVVIYHTYFLPFFVYYSKSVSNLGHFLNDPHFTPIPTMGISIEAYFLFSGLFLVYGRFKRGGSNVRVNVIILLLRRYLRLCPSLLLVIGIILVMPLIGSGPVWGDIFQAAADNSKKYWWTYGLMFNNFLDIKDQNFLYLWFIPCLFQLTIVGAILLWVLTKCRKLGIILIISWAVACNIALGVLTAQYNYPPSYAIYFFHSRESFEKTIYTSPLSHVTSFSIGMLLGYYMSQRSTIKWSKISVCLGWIITPLFTIGIQYWLFVCHDGKDVDTWFSATYGSMHKTLFALGIAWIILACTYGYGGIMAKMLCWKGFCSLSKLGYLAYLVHYLVIAFHVSCTRAPLDFTHMEIWYRIWAYVPLTFLFAYILYISFELPLNKLESLLLPRPKTAAPLDLTIKAKDQDVIRFTPVQDDYRSNFQKNIHVMANNIIQYSENSRL